MKRLWLFLLPFFALRLFAGITPNASAPVPKPPNAVWVCSWNMKWFPSGSKDQASPKEEQKRIDSAARFLGHFWEADIVMMQEVRTRADAEKLVSHKALEGFRINSISDYQPYGNVTAMQQDVIISRYETLDSGWGTWTNEGSVAPPRGYTWAVLNVLGTPVLVVTVHLKSNYIPWYVEDKEAEAKLNRTKREVSSKQLIEKVKELRAKEYGGQEIADVVIGGDFNTSIFQKDYEGERTIPLLKEAGFKDVFEKVPESRRNTMPETKNYPASCFDYLFFAGKDHASGPEVAPAQYTSDHNLIAFVLTVPKARPAPGKMINRKEQEKENDIP